MAANSEHLMSENNLLEAKNSAVDFLNEELGGDSKNLNKIVSIVDELKKKKTELESKLEFLSSATPDKVNNAIKAADSKIEEAENLTHSASDLKDELKNHQKKVSGLLGSVKQQLNIIQQYDNVTVYQKWVSSVQQLSLEMVTLSGEKNEIQLLERFNELESYRDHFADKTACVNLQEYTAKTFKCWHEKLLQDFSKEFESVLESIHYPFLSTNKSASQTPPTADMYERLGILTKHLLILSDPKYSVGNDAKESEGPYEALVADFTPLVTPLNLLLKPLEVRFLFHFNGEKKTNSAANPEWCFTKVLAWINDHHDFLFKYIQPVLNENNYGHVSAKAEITRGLVKLTMIKLTEDMRVLLEDEDLFCHCLQETLNFERELAVSCGYPASQPSVLGVLTQPQILSHWINLERKFAVALMDELVSMPGAWDPLVSEGGEGVSSCGEHLVTLLQGITDRYKTLPQPGHRLQFLEVQIDVLDEFRVRAAQLARECLKSPIDSTYPYILNTLKHVSDTLSDWADFPMFLELQLYHTRQKELEEAVEMTLNRDHKPPPTTPPTTSSSSVFSPCLLLYRHMEEEMLHTLQYHVVGCVRARGVPYRRDKWYLEREVGPGGAKREALSIEDVSPSICPLLEVLLTQLTSLHKSLSSSLFCDLWQAIAKDIDKFLYEEVVLQNHFSTMGGAQLRHDMEKALYPVFFEYTAKPQGHFCFIRECIALLCLPRATAMLLRDTLHLSLHGTGARDLAASSLVKPVAALAEHGVTVLNVERAYTVLNRRTNMASF